MVHKVWLGPALGLLVWAILAFVFLLVGGLVLRAACALFNRMAEGSGKAGRVPVPETGKAMIVVLGCNLLQFPIDFLIDWKLGRGFSRAGDVSIGALLWRAAIFWLVGVFVTSGVLSGGLPTGFGRSTLVSLLYNALLLPLGCLAGVLAWALVRAGLWYPLVLGGR
jgi:hypothetical protein